MNASDNPLCALTVEPALTPPRSARLDIQLAQLDRLSEAGLDMARALADQAQGTGPQVFAGDLALAYSRVSRAVRMAILIQSRLMNDVQARQKAVIEAEVDRDNTRFDQEQRRKGAVENIVGRICRAHPDGYDAEEVELCVRAAGEYLDEDDINGDVVNRLISDLVAQVCHDLNLDIDWPAQAQQPWAQRELASGDVGQPLTPYLPRAAVEGASGRDDISASTAGNSS